MLRLLILLLLLLGPSVGQGQTTNSDVPPSGSAGADAVAAPLPPVDPAKEAEIRKLLVNLDVKGTMKSTLARVLDTYRKKYPDLPADFWTQVVSDSSLDDLVSRLVPVYGQFYSLEDLKAINAFYESPVGQHMRQTKTQLAAAEALIGRQWGREIGAKVMSGIFARQAKTYADEDKKRYYTAVSTNGAPSLPAANASAPLPVSSPTPPEASPTEPATKTPSAPTTNAPGSYD